MKSLHSRLTVSQDTPVTMKALNMRSDPRTMAIKTNIIDRIDIDAEMLNKQKVETFRKHPKRIRSEYHGIVIRLGV